MSYEVAKQARDDVEARMKTAGKAMQAFPKLANGLTPDSVKFTAEYRNAASEYARAFQELQRFNKAFTVLYRAEIRAERRAR